MQYTWKETLRESRRTRLLCYSMWKSPTENTEKVKVLISIKNNFTCSLVTQDKTCWITSLVLWIMLQIIGLSMDKDYSTLSETDAVDHHRAKRISESLLYYIMIVNQINLSKSINNISSYFPPHRWNLERNSSRPTDADYHHPIHHRMADYVPSW